MHNQSSLDAGFSAFDGASDRRAVSTFFDQQRAAAASKVSESIKAEKFSLAAEAIEHVLTFLGDGADDGSLFDRAAALLYMLRPDARSVLPDFRRHYASLLAEYMPHAFPSEQLSKNRLLSQLRQECRLNKTHDLSKEKERIARDKEWFVSSTLEQFKDAFLEEALYAKRRRRLAFLRLEKTSLVRRLSAEEMRDFDVALGLADEAHNYVEGDYP